MEEKKVAYRIFMKNLQEKLLGRLRFRWEWKYWNRSWIYTMEGSGLG
jgi:hypothetical protein